MRSKRPPSTGASLQIGRGSRVRTWRYCSSQATPRMPLCRMASSTPAWGWSPSPSRLKRWPLGSGIWSRAV